MATGDPGWSGNDRDTIREPWQTGWSSRSYRDGRAFTHTVVVMFYYAVLAVLVVAVLLLAALLWVVMSPVIRAMARGNAIDPAQWGRWQDHLEDDGLGPSWRSDGYGGKRETKVYSKHTRRHY